MSDGHDYSVPTIPSSRNVQWHNLMLHSHPPQCPNNDNENKNVAKIILDEIKDREIVITSFNKEENELLYKL